MKALAIQISENFQDREDRKTFDIIERLIENLERDRLQSR